MTHRRIATASLALFALCLTSAQNVKTVGGVSLANVKTVGGVAKANAKTIGGVDNTAGGGGGTVTFDAVATGQINTGTGTTLTYSFTMGSVTDGCLTVFANLGEATGNLFASCTYAGTAMTQIGTTQQVGGSGNGRLAAWRLTAAQGLAAGTANVVITTTAPLDTSPREVICSVALSWANVDQTTPVDNVVQGASAPTSTNPSRTVTSATNSRALAAACAGDAFSAVATTARSTATQHNYSTATGGGCLAVSERAGSASETFTYTISSSDTWANFGFNLRHN